MTSPVVGITIQREANEPAPPSYAQMSVVGLCGPFTKAAGVDQSAFDTKFPLDKCVRFQSTDATSRMIDPDSDFGVAISLINAQLGRLQTGFQCVVVRTAVGADDDATIANIVGNASARTGIHAFRRGGPDVGVYPRLIHIPGGWAQVVESVGGSVGVVSAPKAGGNTGNGTLTPASPAYGASIKAGVYQVRCTGGARSASSAAKAGGNTGTGTMGSLTADTTAAVGAWRVICQIAAANGGTFVVYKPDGTFDGIAAVGSAYNSPAGINFTIADGSTDFIVGDEFVVTVTASVPANGGVFSVTDPDGIVLAEATVGTPYTGNHVRFTIADGSTDFAVGDGFDLTVTIAGGTMTTNPIIAELPSVLNAFLGIAYVQSPGLTAQEDQNFRETFASERVGIVTPGVYVEDSAGDKVETDAAAIAIGLHVRRDFEFDGRPFRSIMNQAVYGIVAPTRNIEFSWVDGSVEAQQPLLGIQIGPIVRGEAGDDFAVSDGGYKFMGFENTGDEAIWQQMHKVRGRDFIELTIIRSMRQYFGKFNLTRQTIETVVGVVENMLAVAEAKGDILGYVARFDPNLNNADDLRSGHIYIEAKFDEAPVFRKMTLLSRPFRFALDDLIAALNGELEAA